MEMKSQIARIYLGSAFQVNFSANLGRLIQAHGWKNKEEVFAVYDEETGEIRVSKNPSIIMKASSTSEGEKETPRRYLEHIQPATTEILRAIKLPLKDVVIRQTEPRKPKQFIKPLMATA